MPEKFIKKHHAEEELRERDFTGGGILAREPKKGTTGDLAMDEKVAQLVREWNCGRRSDLIEEMIITALRLGRDEITQGDLKLFNRSLKEMRKAQNVFQPYQDYRKVVAFGSARTAPDAREYLAAMEFGKKMRERGYMMITGGGEGIMGAAQKGAGRENGFGLNIRLPFEQDANETISGDPKLIDFNYFFTRKLSFIKEADAVACFPGGFGTMDETFEALTLMQTGKARIFPLVMVDVHKGTYWKSLNTLLTDHLLRNGLISEEDFCLFKVTDDLDEAIEEICLFYRNFHSYRYVGNKLIIRLQKSLTDAALAKLNSDFADILRKGQIEQGKAHPKEVNEPELAELPRLILQPYQYSFGRKRCLINAINAAQTV